MFFTVKNSVFYFLPIRLAMHSRCVFRKNPDGEFRSIVIEIPQIKVNSVSL